MHKALALVALYAIAAVPAAGATVGPDASGQGAVLMVLTPPGGPADPALLQGCAGCVHESPAPERDRLMAAEGQGPLFGLLAGPSARAKPGTGVASESFN